MKFAWLQIVTEVPPMQASTARQYISVHMLKLEVNAFQSIFCCVSLTSRNTAASLAELLKRLSDTETNDVVCDYQLPMTAALACGHNHVDINDNTLLVSPFFTANKTPPTAKSWI